MAEPTPDADDVVVTSVGGVATLWLNRPEKRNAVTFDMWRTIAEVCDGLAVDPDVRVLVIRGTGGHFSAGADIAGFSGAPNADYRAANRAADDGIAEFPKPTIAFVAGACVGGGAEIAIACDLRLADDTARFGITPSRLGIVYPPFAVERAVRLIGPSSAKHLLYSAEIIDAERALRIGLVDELHGPDAARARLDELTGLLAHERSLLTLMASKEMVDAVAVDGRISDEVQARWTEALDTSPDAAEGIAAFLERRPARFRWTPPA